MDYQNTLKYLYESAPMFQQIGGKAYKPGLETTHKLDEHLGILINNSRRYISPEPMEKDPVHIPSQPYCSAPVTG